MLIYDVESFMQYCKQKGLAAKTMASYEQTLRLFVKYLHEQAQVEQTEQVKPEHIAAYIAYIQERGKYTVCAVRGGESYNHPRNRRDCGKHVSPVTINNYLRNMNAFFNWMKAENLIKTNPIKRTHFIKTERKALEYLSDADFKRLLQSIDCTTFSGYRDSVIIQLLLDTGMRVGECLLVKVDYTDMNRRVIFLPADITKGKADRCVFFSDKMAKLLRRWLQYKDRYRDSEYLFCTNQGKPLQVSNFETNIRKYARRVGLKDIHPHVFRNNFAKRFLMNGGDIYTLSRILGHSSVTVTEKAYLDLDVDDLRAQYQSHSPLMHL